MNLRLWLIFPILFFAMPFVVVTPGPYTWATITDDHGGTMVLRNLSASNVAALTRLRDGHDAMWVGGKLVAVNSLPWGFTFKPLVVAVITAEGLQTWLADIKAQKDYWFMLRTAFVCVSPNGVKLYR